ncbi:MAG: succinate dehydrogenase cytochrome b subunit [Desulfobacterales bacterium]|nr:succinate dehydrogenase cytochrome b subunit [Desulfobacterales bacterium]
MNWLIQTLTASIGKKLMMAITGLGFCSFLVVHFIGNLTLFGGESAFTAYAEKLHSLGVLITVAELGLLIMALIHVTTGIILYYQNIKARPVRYSVNKNAGGRTLGSRTAPYTGIILLVFIVYHLLNFHFVDKTDRGIYQIVSETFAKPGYVIIYIFAMIVAALHVRHGLWSAFQTLGANHPKYMPLIMAASIIFGLIIALGFGFIPIYISFIA